MKRTKTRIVGAAVGGTALIAGAFVAVLASPSAHAETRRTAVRAVYVAPEIHLPSNASQSSKNHASTANHYSRIAAHQNTLAAATHGTAHARHHNSAATYERLASHHRQLAMNSR